MKADVPIARRERTRKSEVMIKAENKELEDYFDYFGDQGLVMLTWRQYEHLLAIESEPIVKQYILRLEATIMQYPGFSAHSHYKTILKWMEEDAMV
jgi:predicted aldo/keto reductase-like oxidoreductase